MKVFLDTEFMEDGRTIDLLSIGLVREDGKEYYAEPIDADWSRANDWVREHVLPQLHGHPAPSVKSRSQIRQEIIQFVGERPEFWGYFAAYDWVVLCQLYGTMMDLPEGWPMYCRDLKQWSDMLGAPELPLQEHYALADARWNERVYIFLREYADRQNPTVRRRRWDQQGG